MDQYHLEEAVLRTFLEKVLAMPELDNSVSESKLVKDTIRFHKAALKNATIRCTCAKRRYGMCEDCQGPGNHLHSLRILFRMMKKAKKFNLSKEELKQVIENCKGY